MNISDKLLDTTYIPKQSSVSYADKHITFNNIVRCPVSFTEDPIEYATKFLEYKLKPAQKMVLEDLFSSGANGKPLYKEAVLVCGMRCLGLGTEILMYDGTIKKVEDVEVGDL